MACAALVAAASMSAVLAQAPAEAPAESPSLTEGPMTSASAALPALGVVGASLVSVIAFYLQ